ncbi:bifunctional diaminohydroxyphosphoribosylaminopyrimidine deaminase/5-amino-6-(5-phosphoribosylamino)uracil reductase RibD [Kinneretia asaccharophila]|uniref:Riboflavin biosynthesis protein RibD n=1 Tax=Roseateles asaccharophilus TaxID=582607 RepID=A0A4R6N3S2_9BURK|nr:bifunctional diaminohydroxyphosphoribosylaminopyrimidine deaminase/5-amino-6-(5-phosphoribosylamino)uracil reductase RibD [Roseateles asaccharophilus]MDN3544705.1 bifunctional diaminohydroxyphosphoribosylaminopyrimidine deaminase/5-amino-6-(5-phosphoribosylamino)uracil reductase RibD [Roseateles asaccharophilus]TDP09528.1 diaminohydroxyphosphoribosylaminopyrimidine deaminase/5-amino-6-(5-phosphoribosylamino)uracil reductase [Roseateles asaccharophilus]
MTAVEDSFSAADEAAMRQALKLAEQAIGLSDPNPRVGCVILAPDGRLLGAGHTQAAGQAHAEIMALRDAQTRGEDVRGATAYVTLEPCAHHGRTPPCCDALIAAGLGRVVAALGDPNPQVSGQGMARLQAAGIRTSLGLLAVPARELNIGFFSRMLRGRPFVRMKIAASLDGRTALPDGRSQWITAEPARRDGHAWRRRAGALLTGIGTVREDDPRLDVRWVPTQRQPLRVIVDSRLETPPGARILQPPGQVLIYAAQDAAERARALRATGAEIVLLPDPSGKVDLAALMHDLGGRGINELHVEAGHKLNGSLLRAGLVDEFLIYLAPKLLGQGREMAAFGPLDSLDEAPQLLWREIAPVGEDLRLIARPRGWAL